MLWWTLFFLFAAVVAAILGFGELITGFNKAAKITFWIFLVLFVVSVILYTHTLP